MNDIIIISNINHIQILIDILSRKYDIYLKQLDYHVKNKTTYDDKYFNYVKILYENFMIFLFNIKYYLKNKNIDNNINLDEYSDFINNNVYLDEYINFIDKNDIFLIYKKYNKKINFINNNNNYDDVFNNINKNNYIKYYLLFTFILSKIEDIFFNYKENIILEDIIKIYYIIIHYILIIEIDYEINIFNEIHNYIIDIDKLLYYISYFLKYDKYSPIINIIKNITCILYVSEK